MEQPQIAQFGEMTDSFYVQYIRRKSHFNMASDHFHSFFEIYYLLSGQRLYFIQDTSYPIQEGDLVFIGKYEFHKTLHLGDPFHERIVFHADDQFLHSVAGQHSSLLTSPFQQSSHVLRLPQAERSIVHAHMTRVKAELLDKPPGYELYLKQAFTNVLLTSARYLQTYGPVSISYASPMHKIIAEIVRYLNEHYAEQINLTMISKQFFISPHHLSRMYKKITGFSFVDYLNLTRLREAQRLLRDTEMKISDIAAQVGFENFSHFGKTFKRAAHISARDYRSQNQREHEG